jgi:hypothetical protein
MSPVRLRCWEPGYPTNLDKSEIIARCIGVPPAYQIWAVNNNQLSIKQNLSFSEMPAEHGNSFGSAGVSYRKQ